MKKLSALGLPLLTLVVTAALGVVWAIAHKTRLEAYYTDLAYRTLADIGDSIRNRVYQYDVALSNSCKEWKGPDPCTEWKSVVQLRPRLLGEVRPDDSLARSRLVYQLPSPAGLTIPSPEPGKTLVKPALVRLDLQIVAGDAATEFFDDLILCDDDSNVLFQKSERGRRVVNCSSILASAGIDEKKGGKKDTASAFVLSAQEYPFRVFEHRIELDHPNTSVALGNGANSKKDPTLLTVLGLIRQQRLESEVLAFPFTLSFTFIFIVFVAFFSIPMVRVSMLRANQRLRRWDGAWLTASTFFTASLLTFGLLTLVYYRFEAGQGIDRRLEQIAEEVEAHAGAEFSTQRHILRQVMATAAKQCSDNGADWNKSDCKLLPGPGTLGEFVLPYFDPTLREFVQLNFDSTLDLVSFTALDGKQVSKWTMKKGTPANLIDVKDRGFFTAVVERRMWNYVRPEWREAFFLEPLVSRTTAENVVVQSVRPEQSPRMVVNITSRPDSLFGVFMQPGFGFTIIDREGKILFHSEQSRNLRENLFDDCMDPSELRSAANGRSVRTVEVNYLGRDHRFHITPLRSFTGSPWTLVTFYDKEQLRSTLAGVITVTLALFLGYTLLAALGLIILVTFGFVRNVSVTGFANPVVLLWPNEQMHGSYRGLIAWFTTLLAVEAIALATLTPLALTLLVALMPLIALALSSLWQKVFRWQVAPWVRHLSLRRRYTLASALFLILATVVPCTAFFRTAFDYEMGLVARGEMAALMRHMRGIETAARAEIAKLVLEKTAPLVKEGYLEREGEAYIRSRIRTKSHLGIYSCAALVQKPGVDLKPQADRSAECPFPATYRWMPALGHAALSTEQWPAPVKRWLPGLYDSYAEERFGAANSKDPRMAWGISADELGLESRDPFLPDLLTKPFFLMPSPSAFCCFVVLVGLIFTWMFFLNRRLFLFDLADALPLGHDSPVPTVVEGNLLVLVSPCDDQAMTWNQRPDLCEIDLSNHTGASALDKADGVSGGTGIVLNHFEDRLENPEVLDDRTQLIEKLMSRPGRRIIVISAVDPVYHISTLTDPASQARLFRLSAALAGFTHRIVFQGVVSSTSRTIAAHA